MLLKEIVAKVQSRLLLNDQLIKQLEEEKEDVMAAQVEQQQKIEEHFNDILVRLEKARNSLLSQLDKEVTRKLDSLHKKEQMINSSCLALSPELFSIQHALINEKMTASFDVSSCEERVMSLLTGQSVQEDDDKWFPKFSPSPQLSKVKKADFGFLQLAEFLPQDFSLGLTCSAPSLLPGSLATCSVVTPVGQFTSMVQANIQFTIKQQGSKAIVPFCREECKVSEDQKSFKIAFPVSSPGEYTVTVLLYGQHVQHSPLSVHVPPEKVCQNTKINPLNPTIPRAITSPKSTGLSTSNSTTQPKPTKPRQPNILTHMTRHSLHQQPKSGTDFMQLVTEGCVVENITMKIPAATQRKCGQSTLTMPIGMCILLNKNVAIASTFEDQVKIFSSSGQFLKIVRPGTPFNHPSDMLTLRSGEFVVRDDASIQFFDAEGKYVKSLDTTHINKCYGMTENETGLLITINENKGKAWRKGKVGEEKMEIGTVLGETDLLFFDVETGQLVKRMEMADIIKDKQRSKCRFLTSWQGKLLITDLGMNCIYTLDLASKGVAVCGKTGTGPGCFSDPAGLVVDSKGNWLVADSRNHRLCVYSGQGAWVGEVRLRPGARRPSGLALDEDTGDVYLLNLQGKWALVRYSVV